MAITQSSYVDLTTNGALACIRKLDTDEAIIIYHDGTIGGGGGELTGIVIDNSGATPSLGATQQIWGGNASIGSHTMQVISSTKAVMFSNQSSNLEARTLSRTGDTLTEQTIETIEAVDGLDIRAAMISAGTGLVAYRNSAGSTHRLCRFTISGDTVSAGTPQTHGTTTIARPVAMCQLDSSRVFYMYHESGDDLFFQIIDISSTITEGTPVTLSDGARIRESSYLKTAHYQCVKVDTNKVFCTWHDDDDTPDSTVAVIVNCGIGTTINSFGTAVEVMSTNVDVIAGSPDVLSTDTVAMIYSNASSAGVIETFAISGDTITSNSDSVTTSVTPDTYAQSMQIVETNAAAGEGIVVVRDDADSATISVTKITGLPVATVDELRHLALASDTTNLYITQNKAGTLQHVYYDLSTLTAQGTASLGAATYAQVDANTYGIYPVVKADSEQLVYLRGRDGNDLQVQHNDLNGTLGWVDDGPGTATWGTAKFAVSLSPDPLRSDDMTVAFSDDDLYRTEDNAATWTKYGDASDDLRAGLRFATSHNEHITGGTAAGSAFYTPNWGVSFEDVSGTALGTIEWFEESR